MKVWNLVFAILWFVVGVLFYYMAVADNQTIALLICLSISMQFAIKAREDNGD